MVRPIYVPQAGRFVNFSDTASDEDIKSYIKTKFPKPQPVAPAAAPAVAPPAESDESGILGRFAYGLGTGITDVPGGIASLLYPAEEAAKTSAGQFSEGARKYLEETFSIDPTKEATTPQFLAQTLGSAASFLIPGGAAAKGASLIGKGAALAGRGATLAGRAGTVTAAGQGVALGAESRAETIRQQLASGMEIPPEAQLAAQRLDGLIGVSEALPMGKFFEPLATILSKVPASKAAIVERIVQSRLANITKAGIQEAAQEVASGIASDLVEYGVYNPNVEIGQDIFSSAAGGAFAGSTLEGIIQLAAGRKLRGARQLKQDLAKERQENSAALRQARVADAAEKLRQTGVEGNLTVEANEDPEGRQRFTILSPKREALVDLYNPDDAVQAVDMYKQNTGANVSLEVKEAPKLDPVRIGGLRFPTVEAAYEERQKILKHVQTLERYGSDIEAVSKEAALRKMQPQALFKQIEQSLKTHRNRLAMFDRYFSTEPGPEPIQPGPKVKTPEAPKEVPTAATPAAVTPEATTAAPVETPVVAEAAPTESIELPEPEPMSPDEPITSEEQVPEMPIGAVEMPVEESRVLPDEIVDSATGPISTAEPVDVKVEKRPAATVEDLAALQEELFGQRINIREMTPEQRAIYEAERDTRFPPQDVNTYYAAGQVNEPVPQNLREAAIHGPVVKDYTPETERRMKGIYEALQARLDAIVPDAAKLELKALIKAPAGYLVRGEEKPLETQYGIKSIVDLATGVLKPGMTVDAAVKELSSTLNHEIIHVLRTKGVIRPAEWNVLTRSVASTNVPGKKYTYMDKAEAVYTPMGPDGIPRPISPVYANPDAVIEEAVADLYRDWVNGDVGRTPAAGLLNRIREFFRRIFQTLRNARHDEVFKKIETGEIGRRADGVPRKTGERFSSGPVGSPGAPMSGDLNDRDNRAFDLYPYLRSSAPRYYDHNRIILGGTNPGNAAAQIRGLDALLARHRNTLESNQAFADYLADAMGKIATPQTGVPIVPYAAVMYANNPNMIARQLERMTPGQLAMAEEGLSASKEFESAYRNGTATPVHTAKLILWGILSRGVSPFVQESMFLDVVKPTGISNRTGMAQGGIDQFINDAIDGEFDLEAYMDYVRTLKLDGLPGAGTTHNLGAFGKTTLVKLQQRIPDGRTILQYLHDMISDYSLSGKEIRRRFHEVNPGIGINNKVLSFMMLVSGRDDVLVLDRVQMRNQFNDGRFDDYNLYDGEKIEKEVTKNDGVTKLENVTDRGTGIAHIGDGVFGLMYYEALERDLSKAVRQAYNMLGRGNQFSMGRYHWESWVATSSQEVDHGSVTGLIKEATGEENPYGGIYTGEGKYDTFNSGIRYGYTREGEAYVALPDGLGKYYFFTPEYAKKVIKGYAKRSTGIISDATFKVSESTEGPWYDRPEVNKERLRQYLRAQAELFKNERRLALSKRISEIGKDNPNGSGPGPVHTVRRRGGVRQPYYTHPKETPSGVRFSAAPTLESPEFKRWFKNSVAVNPDGTPARYYHGTPFSFKQFGKGRSGSIQGEEGPFFFSSSPGFTEDYSLRRNYAGGDRGDVEAGGRTIPVYISVQKPFDYENPRDVAAVVAKVREMHNNGRYPLTDKADRNAADILENKLETLGYDLEDGDWPTIEKENIQRAIRELGYDGFFVKENKQRNLAVFKPEQVKSIFNQFEEGAAESRRFSAAPLPTYVEEQNDKLFAKSPNIPVRDKMFDWAFGHFPEEKIVRVNGRDVPISKWTMRGVAGKAAVVDKAAFVTELEKTLNLETTGNYQRMQADYSATAALAWLRRASHIMASMMLRGNLTLQYDRHGDILSATMKVEDDTDSLKEVFKVMAEPAYGDKTKGDIFKTYAIARRGEWLRSTGQTVPRELTPQYVREAITSIQRDYPEVVEAYNMYQRFNKKLMTTVRDAGLISTAELGRLTNQMNYYGFIYEMYGEPLGPNSPQKAASQFKLRPYTGSQYGGLVNDPMFVMIQNAQFMVTSVAKNLAATKSLKLAELMGEARQLQTNEAPNEFQGEQPDVMFMSENGVVKRYAVKDPLMVTALGSDDRINVGKFWETLGLPAHILRESITRDPGFMARNLMRDTVSAWGTSGVDFIPVYDTLKNFTLALKSGGSFKDLSARGVVGSYDLAMQTPAELSESFKRGLPKNVHAAVSVEGLSAGVRTLWNRLGQVSEASDAATRMAVYDALIKQGMTEAEAAMQAIELLDFTRRGASQTLGILTKLIPFLNARIQGLDVLYQAGRSAYRYGTGKSLGERDSRVGKKFLIRGAMLAAIAVALEKLNEDDEDYAQLDDYIKNGNLIIPLKHFGLPGEFIAVPKPFEYGLLFATFPQQIYKTYQGDASTRDNVNLFWDQFAGTFGVNPIPQALLPPIEIITNHNFFTGLPLISEGKARLAPELQYNTSTSQLAMMIGGLPIFYDFTTGRFGGASPIIIDKLISGYGGPVGTYLAQAIGLAMQDAEIGPERMPIELSNAPVVRSFFIDAKTKNPKVVTQAYELFRIADEANRTVSRLKQMNDAEGLMEYVNKNRDILTYKKYIFKLTDSLNKLSAQERLIERDTKMTREEKFAAQERLREIRIRLASQVGMINQKLGR